MVDKPEVAMKVLNKIDGMTLTLHTPEDGKLLINFNNALIRAKLLTKGKSLKLNIFSGVNVFYLDKIFWNVIKENITWIEDCPLPEGEVFKKLGEQK
jgi:hypothetical protein